MERKRTAVLAVALAGASLAGCGSMPEQNQTLEQARSLVQSLEAEPVTDRVAREELSDARNAIEQADETLEDRGEEQDVDYLAYVALRNAQIAEQLVATQSAREQLEDAEADRTRVLLQAREQDAREAEATAESRGEALERQREIAEEQRERASELEQELSDLQAQETERGVVLTLGDVLFETDQAQLQPGADMTIGRLVRFLNEYPDRRIIIEGHTDSTGPAEYNEQLSRDRAQAVQDALLDQGIQRNRVEVRGLGEEYPVASNDTVAGRQLNRRVEIVVSDDSGEFAPEAERTVRAAPQREREG